MTVAENICLTLGYPRRYGMVDWRAAQRRAAAALERLGVDIHPDVRIQSLSRTEKSLVAIARALAADAEVLVLDEPTASLPADEVARLFVALRRLRDRGVGIDLRLAPARRGVRDRRPHGGAARRARRRRAAGGGDDAGGGDPPHRRPRALAGLPPAAAAPGVGAARPRFAHDRGGRAGRLRDSRRRGRRLRRPARGRAGKGRTRALRHPSDHGRPPAARRRAARARLAAPRHGARHQPRLRGSGGRVRRRQHDDPREPLPQPAGRRARAVLDPRPAPRDARRAGARPPGRACGPTTPRCRSSFSPAATSRRSSSGAGFTSPRRSTSSRIRRRASTSAPRPRSTASSTWR